MTKKEMQQSYISRMEPFIQTQLIHELKQREKS